MVFTLSCRSSQKKNLCLCLEAPFQVHWKAMCSFSGPQMLWYILIEEYDFPCPVPCHESELCGALWLSMSWCSSLYWLKACAERGVCRNSVVSWAFIQLSTDCVVFLTNEYSSGNFCSREWSNHLSCHSRIVLPFPSLQEECCLKRGISFRWFFHQLEPRNLEVCNFTGGLDVFILSTTSIIIL